jgi:putative FmdB family regulatory protein
MIYMYSCTQCGVSREEVRKVDDRNLPAFCMICGQEMIRVPCYQGGLQTEHPAWLKDTEQGLGKTFSTRTEHDRHCRDNGLQQR